MFGKILVVDDDPGLVTLLQQNLQHFGFETTAVTDGGLAVPEARRLQPDVVLLDLVLPGIHGFEICRQLRSDEDLADVAIVILSAKADEMDRVTGLELGADDYVAKPFQMRELISRIQTVCRRRELSRHQALTINGGALVIDPEAHLVRVLNKPVELSVLEFRLLHFLAMHAGRTYSREQLIARIWRNRAPDPRTVDVLISRIREKIEDDSTGSVYLLTTYGIGYRFACFDD